jgi:hypothetical protein
MKSTAKFFRVWHLEDLDARRFAQAATIKPVAVVPATAVPAAAGAAPSTPNCLASWVFLRLYITQWPNPVRAAVYGLNMVLN